MQLSLFEIVVLKSPDLVHLWFLDSKAARRKRDSSEDGVDVGFDGHGQILRDATQGVKACPGPFDTFNGLVGKAGKATGNHGFDS